MLRSVLLPGRRVEKVLVQRSALGSRGAFQGSCLSGEWVRARACVPEGFLTQVMGRWVGCNVTHLVYPLGCCKLTGFDVRLGRD